MVKGTINLCTQLLALMHKKMAPGKYQLCVQLYKLRFHTNEVHV